MSEKQSSYIKDGQLFEKYDEGGEAMLFCADFKEGYVRTNCVDIYSDYSIRFDDFIKFAEFIKKEREKYGKEI